MAVARLDKEQRCKRSGRRSCGQGPSSAGTRLTANKNRSSTHRLVDEADQQETWVGANTTPIKTAAMEILLQM